MTSTPTNTPTLTPTNTPTVTPTPNNHGSGTCWRSGPSWPSYTVYYDIDSSIPPSWIPSIEASAEAWNNVAPSHFTFVRQTGSSNTIRYEVPATGLAGTAAWPDVPYYEHAYTKIDPNKPWDTNNSSPSPTAYNVQNVMTHEFGHWLYLDDINETNCTHVTMDWSAALGEIIKITLEIEDKTGINWQYP
jgi:hypothetical protein